MSDFRSRIGSLRQRSRDIEARVPRPSRAAWIVIGAAWLAGAGLSALWSVP